MKLTIREEAEEDALTAALWYESRREGLGCQFRDDSRLCTSRYGSNLSSLA